MKRNTKPTDLQRRLAECEKGAQLIKALFDAGDCLPDWLTDAVMDAISAASQLKRVEYFGETDFDLEGLATLFLATRDLSFRYGTDAVAFHVSKILQNPDDCPLEVYDALADATCSVEADHNTFGILARQFRGHAEREAVKA
jgi:hypothetical protein